MKKILCVSMLLSLIGLNSFSQKWTMPKNSFSCMANLCVPLNIDDASIGEGLELNYAHYFTTKYKNYNVGPSISFGMSTLNLDEDFIESDFKDGGIDVYNISDSSSYLFMHLGLGAKGLLHLGNGFFFYPSVQLLGYWSGMPAVHMNVTGSNYKLFVLNDNALSYGYTIGLGLTKMITNNFGCGLQCDLTENIISYDTEVSFAGASETISTDSEKYDFLRIQIVGTWTF